MKKYKYKNLSSSEVKKKCKKLFIENYITDESNNRVIIKTLKNERVIFNEKDYYHAFGYRKKISNVNSFGYQVEKFSFQRARCILWIKEVLIGNNLGAIRKDIDAYVYFYDQSEKYLIVLKKLKSGDLRFITHYVIKNLEYLRKIEEKILSE